VVEQALGHGHEVRALVRSSPLEITHPRLEVVIGDACSLDDVQPAVAGCDAVVFAVGSGGGRDVRVYSEGVAHVMHSMAVHGVRRLVAVSAAGAFARKDPRISPGFRLMIATVLKPVYDDMERMEQRIAASGLDWTVIRPVGLTDGPQSGRYRLSQDGSLLPKASRIARADVAALALKAVETGSFFRMTLVISQ
jgi:putative NADH-flavin reductase